jgi:hypothetical protein
MKGFASNAPPIVFSGTFLQMKTKEKKEFCKKIILSNKNITYELQRICHKLIDHHKLNGNE